MLKSKGSSLLNRQVTMTLLIDVNLWGIKVCFLNPLLPMGWLPRCPSVQALFGIQIKFDVAWEVTTYGCKDLAWVLSWEWALVQNTTVL